MSRLLVVDGAQSVREAVRMILGGEHEVARAASLEEAAAAAAASPPDLVLAGGPAGGRRRPAGAEAPFAAPLREAIPDVRLLSLPLPFAVADLRGRVRRALEAPAPGARTAAPAAWPSPFVKALLEGADPEGRLGHLAARAAATGVPVLLLGERGTGRETLARAIHAAGPDAAGPFVVLACTGLTPEALDARLAALPVGGPRPTVFLKALDEASPAVQAALLDRLDDGRLGRDARPLASASDLLDDRVEAGLLSEPLVAALGVLRLSLPPLRERPDLIGAIAPVLLERIRQEGRLPRPCRLTPDAVAGLASYVWPGNLAELSAVLARSAALADGEVLEAADVDFGIAGYPAADVPAPSARTFASPAEQTTPEDHRFAALAAELAHEVKNPLVAIKTFTQLLGEKFDDPEFRREFYAVVKRDVERIDHLVEAVLHAADAVPTELGPIDLNALLEAVIGESEGWMVERRVVAFRDLAERAPMALADREQARAALFNVVARALASLPPGEDLFLATRRGRDGVEATVSYRDASPHDVGLMGARGEELEIALARTALARAGGQLEVHRDPKGRTTVTLAFRPAEPNRQAQTLRPVHGRRTA